MRDFKSGLSPASNCPRSQDYGVRKASRAGGRWRINNSWAQRTGCIKLRIYLSFIRILSPWRFSQSTERPATVSETQAGQGRNRRRLKGIYKERAVLKCDVSYLAISCDYCAHRTGSNAILSPRGGFNFVPDQSRDRRSGPSLHLTGYHPHLFWILFPRL